MISAWVGASLTGTVGYHLVQRNLSLAQLWLEIAFFFVGALFVAGGVTNAIFESTHARWMIVTGCLVIVPGAWIQRSRSVALKDSWATIRADYESYREPGRNRGESRRRREYERDRVGAAARSRRLSYGSGRDVMQLGPTT